MLPRAVTFDFGETLATLDAELLVTKLARLGATASSARIVAALPDAWEIYQRAGHPGSADSGGGRHPWKPLMAGLLAQASVPDPSRHGAFVDALFDDQPRANLWRKPIPGMIELVRELAAHGVPVGVLSNSEGRLAELVAELAWTRDLPVVIDSGRVGVAKPEPAIFRLAADALGVAVGELIHVGDSLRADVMGALDAGAAALWFTSPPAYPDATRTGPAGVPVCRNACETRAALFARLGLPVEENEVTS
ncbi:MAG: HAD-IA family hydrolase [Deltaproteobacteria bacterium]|nr:HAD-IA family hydrolase [Deltaproteobacteria bacterium]